MNNEARTAEGPNADLFVQVLAQIEAQPEQWNQEVWGPSDPDCGTACCFAGWTPRVLGLPVVRNYVGDLHVSAAAPGLLGVDADCINGDCEHAHDWNLFYGGNTLDDLYRISADILGIDETVLREKVAAEVAA